MITVENLAKLLNCTVEYMVQTYIGKVHPKYTSILSKGFFGFAEAIDIINAEGNRGLTQAAKDIQNKLRAGDVLCGSFGYLVVR